MLCFRIFGFVHRDCEQRPFPNEVELGRGIASCLNPLLWRKRNGCVIRCFGAACGMIVSWKACVATECGILLLMDEMVNMLLFLCDRLGNGDSWPI